MTKKVSFREWPAPLATSLNKGPLVQPGANGGGSRAYWHGVRIHRKCRDCQKTCKQSPKVLLIKCPQYEAKDAKA